MLGRVVVPERASLRAERPERDFGSILVPLFGGRPRRRHRPDGGAARRLGEQTDEAAIDKATIEAIWIFEVPMALPLDARLPEEQLKAGARGARARQGAWARSTPGVEVATATVRARRTGHAIVEEARRRGVEAIVLAADEALADTRRARCSAARTRHRRERDRRDDPLRGQQGAAAA